MKARSLSRSPSPTRSESPYGRRQASRSPSYSNGDTRHRKVNNSRSPSRSPSVKRYCSRSPSRSRSSRRYRSRRSPSYSRSSRSCSRSPSPLPRRKRDRSPSYSHSPRRSYSPRHRRTYGGRHRSQTPRRRRRECRSRSYSSCSRSPSYSPRHRRRYSYRSPTPRKGRKGYSHRDSATSLLIRNLSRDCGTGDLRRAFEEFGPIKDVYIPRDYYTSEPRGFGFVQFVYPQDADDAQYYMNRCIIYGREIIVVFAEENRKTPNEMRTRDRKRHPSSGYDSIGRSPSSDSLNSGPARSRSSSPTQQR